MDRDGVINKPVLDLVSPEQFELLDGVPAAIKKINDSGYLAIIVTNQPVIAKGFVTTEGMDEIHRKMAQLLGNARIDKIYMCPHHPEKGFDGEVKELKIECGCRKPKPGMLLLAAADFDIDLKNSWLIGDSDTDIAAGKAAGCNTIFIPAEAKNLLEAVGRIINK
ncbi:HAD family hydrolase [Candidatus Woesearchaeota archaeon]|nr:HAD family hydrolase [Candidatus Woesearchaeota archaeon]